MFKLDNRIEQDSFLVKESNDFQIRIMDVREVFWVILIPTKINLIELSDLDVDKRNNLINFAIELGDFLKSNEKKVPFFLSKNLKIFLSVSFT